MKREVSLEEKQEVKKNRILLTKVNDFHMVKNGADFPKEGINYRYDIHRDQKFSLAVSIEQPLCNRQI